MFDPLLMPTRSRKTAGAPVFTPRGATATERLQSVVQQARLQPLIFVDAEFDLDEWEVTEADVTNLGGSGWVGRRWMRFTTETARLGRGVGVPIAIRDFAKSYFKRLPRASMSVLTERRVALCYIGIELEALGLSSVTAITPAVLQGAVSRARAERAESGMVGVADQIALVARTLRTYRLTDAPLGDWTPSARLVPTEMPDNKSSFPSFPSHPFPAEGYLDALATAFGIATHPVDVTVASALTISACCWGQRIGSVLVLQEDCVEGLDDGQHLAVRFTAFKGQPGEAIDVPDELAPFVRNAIARVLEVTQEGRAIRRAYQRCRDEIALPQILEHARGKEWLTYEEAKVLTGLSNDSSLYTFLHANSIGRVVENGDFKVSLRDFERHFLSRLPIRARDTGGWSARPLFILPDGSTRRRTGGGREVAAMFQPVSYANVQSRLGTEGRASLWKCLGIDRDFVRDRTNAIRHWFATIGVSRGVSGEDLSELQRRRTVRENRHYIHLPKADFEDLGERTAAVIAAGAAAREAHPATASAPRLAAHAGDLARSQGLDVSDEA